jgi:D-alanyl-D-alanine carboxypeptidase
MRPKSKFRIILILFSLLFIQCNQKTQDENINYSEQLDVAIQKGFKGFILGVYNLKTNKSWVGANGLSNIEQNIAMDKNDCFHVGSVTKLITAIATLRLIELNKLALNTKVIDILDLPEIKKIPYIESIEIQNLLNHTSGIYGFNNDMKYISSLLGESSNSNKKWTSIELLTLADSVRVKPFGKPNTGIYYGDTNYVLLDLIINKVSGKSLRDFVKEEIIDKIGLKNTAYYGEQDNPIKFELECETQGYINYTDEIQSIIKIDEKFPRVNDSLVNTTVAAERIDGAAGIVSTANDLLILAKHLFQNKLLSEKSMEFLNLPSGRLTKNNSETGTQAVLQFFKRKYGILYVASGDGTSGFHSMLVYEPKSTLIIVLYTNIFGLFTENEIMLEIVDNIIMKEKNNN